MSDCLSPMARSRICSRCRAGLRSSTPARCPCRRRGRERWWRSPVRSPPASLRSSPVMTPRPCGHGWSACPASARGRRTTSRCAASATATCSRARTCGSAAPSGWIRRPREDGRARRPLATVSGLRRTAPLGPMTIVFDTVASPVGDLLLIGDGEGLTGLHMQEGPGRVEPPGRRRPQAPPFAAAREQLAEYFAGRRTRFELPLAPRGTEFQRRVWEALEDVRFGDTATYGELATRLGAPAAARAVGAANGRNPISIVIPVPPAGGLRRRPDRIRRRARSQALSARPRGRVRRPGSPPARTGPRPERRLQSRLRCA